MRFHLFPQSLLHLVTTLLLSPIPTLANPHPPGSALNGFGYNELFARYECGGQLCGWNDQLCCTAGSQCYTNAQDQAACGSASASGGYSSVAGSASYVSAAPSASASGATCNYALNESPCGDICCKGNQYCKYVGHCAAAAASATTKKTSAGVVVASSQAGAPIRPTSSGVVVVTKTHQPTTTQAFESPVATGANVTMIHSHSGGGGGLSGGAIAGIVIGVLVALLILGLICFYCCLKGLLDGCLALFGLGSRRRKRTEVEEYERRTHHSSGRGGGRTWYGAAKPSRVDRREKRESHVGRDLLGMGAGLAGLWAVLGLKRRRNKRHEEKSEYSYSSDYYTSSSSASSDDRRHTHRSASRSRR